MSIIVLRSFFKKKFSPLHVYEKSIEADESRSLVNLDQRDMADRIYVGERRLLYTRYISFGPHGFREDMCLVFPIVSLWKLLIAGQFGPQELEWLNLGRGPLDIVTY